MESGPRSASESKGFIDKPADWLESSCLSLRLVEWGFAPLNAGAQHWRNMSSVARAASPQTAAVTPGPSNL
jgi:hypothetical protein